LNEAVKTEGKPAAVVSRGLLAGHFRVFAVKADRLVEESMHRQKLSPVAAAALGRLMMAGMMMALDIKLKKTRITLKIDGGGPLGLVVADAEPSGRVRGYVTHPEVDLPPTAAGKLDVSAGVGNKGTLSVFRDVRMKEPVSSQVPLLSGEVAEDIAHYYRLSEQTATAVGLGVLASPGRVVSAGGYMVQVLPGAPESLIGMIEERIGHTPSVSRLMEAHPNARSAVETLFPGLATEWFEDVEFTLSCRCSRDLARALLEESLGNERQEGTMEVRCHFCGTSYLFPEGDLSGTGLGTTVPAEGNKGE
jgi:molecular chaperone Hsp33